MTKLQPWKEVHRETLLNKYGRAVDKVDFKLPSGRIADYYIKREQAALCAVALTPDQDVIMTRQYRPGPNAILLELPGGAPEPGETNEQAIAREVLEETGYTGNLRFVTSCIDDAYTEITRYIYVATNCQKTAEPILTDSEQIEVAILTLAEFRDYLRSGRGTDIEAGYLALDFLGLL